MEKLDGNSQTILRYRKEYVENKSNFMDNLLYKYTEDDFFYLIMNNLLRNETSVSTLMYIQPFYKRIYKKIREIY